VPGWSWKRALPSRPAAARWRTCAQKGSITRNPKPESRTPKPQIPDPRPISPHRKSVTLSVGTPLRPYPIAYRRAYPAAARPGTCACNTLQSQVSLLKSLLKGPNYVKRPESHFPAMRIDFVRRSREARRCAGVVRLACASISPSGFRVQG
jgi:hypothetical protein